ncbi:sigma-70 family RNA polymerase sigma factor (plasmid) [Verrucomicrobiaceae bacterium 227]
MDFGSQEAKTKLSIRDDRELVLLARSGRQDAFVEIVARYQNLVVGVALSILQDFAKSEDAAQDCFVKAWKRMPHLREPDKLRPWLAQIARNSALDHLRRDHSVDSAMGDFELIEDLGSRPDELLVQAEERETVLKALGSLPEKYRLPLVLFYCDDNSIRAVAEALELSEDTVKQRLSRGRSMLRKRMSGLIDSVLGSARLGRSNALFTASVATAIGALTKPSALAAAAISTTVPPTTTTTLSTSLAMTSTKSTLSTVALLMAVSLPIGYSAHKLIEGNPTPTAVTQIVGPDSHSKPTEEPFEISTKESHLVKQWRKLRANYGDQNSDLMLLHAEIAAMPNRIHRRAFIAVLIAEWAELHAAKGLQFFRDEGRDDWERDLFLHEMFRMDADQAIDVLMASGEGWEEFAPKFLNEIAKQSPNRLSALIDLLPVPGYHRDLSVENAFDLYAQSDLQAARRAAEEVSGPNRPKALAGIARAWAAQDGQAALGWTESMEDAKLRESTKWAVLVGWARVDSTGALDRLPSTPVGPSDGPASMVLSEAAEHDFDATMIWLRENRGRFGSGSLWGLGASFNQRLSADPIAFLSNLEKIGVLGSLVDNVDASLSNEAGSSRAEIMEWLLTSETSPEKTVLERRVLEGLARDQTTSAMKIAEGLADPEKREKAIKTVASGMTNGGQAFDVADQLFDKASPIWKEAITSEAFRYLFSNQVPNFQTWADRMEYLPDAQRTSAHEKMGRSWAEVEPANAVDWALARSDKEQREAAIEGVSSGWASSSPGDAREWIESQLTGSDRKIAVSGFVTGAFWPNFDDAVAMVKTIPSDQARVETIKEVINSYGTHQPMKVLQMIEEIALPKALQEELRETTIDKK